MNCRWCNRYVKYDLSMYRHVRKYHSEERYKAFRGKFGFEYSNLGPFGFDPTGLRFASVGSLTMFKTVPAGDYLKLITKIEVEA